ncbi:LysR family transcriptional regulator [Microvirga sp. W0021]|uniref:LysR family transcriptional regulator n=1 Tax=Hohaiivirga grylli TaxID=3133970 RepID=A0ABV0BFJ3_9HYPH
MNERDWKLLLVLHEQGSITKASNVLHLTQPALSTRLRLIEDFFGVQAVVRGKKGVQFTAEGEYLVRKARHVLGELEGIRDTLDSMRNATAGTLRIGASHFFTRYLLPPLLKEFKARYPDVEFRVYTGWDKETMNRLLANDIHIAFIREDWNWTGIKRRLFSENVLVVHKDPFSIEELPQLPQIHFTSEPSNQMLIDNWWAEQFTVPAQVGMVVDRVDACLEMVKVGLGYGFLPARILQGHKGLHVEAMRYRSGAFLERGTWMLLRDEASVLSPVQEFVQLVEETDFSGSEYI